MTPLTIVIEDFNASGGLRVLTAVANVAAEQGIYPAGLICDGEQIDLAGERTRLVDRLFQEWLVRGDHLLA